MAGELPAWLSAVNRTESIDGYACRLAADILVRLLAMLDQRGLRTLGEVREAARRTAQARRREARYAGR